MEEEYRRMLLQQERRKKKERHDHYKKTGFWPKKEVKNQEDFMAELRQRTR